MSFNKDPGFPSVGISRYLLTGWVFPWLSVNQPPFSVLQLGGGIPSHFATESHSVSRLWVGPQCFSTECPLLGTFKWEGARTCYTSPNVKPGSSTNMRDPEPEETQSNLSWTPKEMDGHKGPLLVPRLQIPVELRQRRRNLLWVPLCWLPKLSTKNYSHNLKAERILFGENVMTSSLEGSCLP